MLPLLLPLLATPGNNLRIVHITTLLLGLPTCAHRYARDPVRMVERIEVLLWLWFLLLLLVVVRMHTHAAKERTNLRARRSKERSTRQPCHGRGWQTPK